MKIDGSASSRNEILNRLKECYTAEEDDRKVASSRRQLHFEQVTFDGEITAACMELFQRRQCDNSAGHGMVQSLKISRCQGHVNDLIMAAMSLHSSVECLQYIQHAPQQPEQQPRAGGVGAPSSSMALHSSITFSISFGIKYKANLRELTLCLLPLTLEQVNLVCKALAVNTTLESLSLAGSMLLPSQLIHVVAGLRFALCLNKGLKRLSLDSLYLDDDLLSDICRTLYDHPCLESLSLKKNSVHSKTMAALALLLHANKLVELDISYMIRQPKATTQEIESDPSEDDYDSSASNREGSVDEDDETDQSAHSESERENKDEDNEDEKEDPDGAINSKDDEIEEETQPVANTSLKVLRVAGNSLNNRAVGQLLNIFSSENSSLESLNLIGNYITDEGMKELCERLLQFPNLKYLNLSLNPFQHAGSQQVIEILMEPVGSTFFQTWIDQGCSSGVFGTDQRYKREYQRRINYYAHLNRGGRKILRESTNPNDATSSSSLALALWPLILERVQRISYETVRNDDFFSGDDSDDDEEEDDGDAVDSDVNDTEHVIARKRAKFSSADVIFCLLHGPVLFSNPYLLDLRQEEPKGRRQKEIGPINDIWETYESNFASSLCHIDQDDKTHLVTSYF